MSAIYPKDFVRTNLQITDISVHEDRRRQGIGSRLLKHILSDVRFCKAARLRQSTCMLMLLGTQTTSEGVEVTLETSQPANLPFDDACGLELRGSFEVDHYRFGALPRHYLLASRRAEDSDRSRTAAHDM